MLLSEIQVELFRDLLDQFLTDHSTTREEAFLVHTYLFARNDSPGFPKNDPVAEVARYLEEIIAVKKLLDIEALFQYYDGKAQKVNSFLETLIRKYEEPKDLVEEESCGLLRVTSRGLESGPREPNAREMSGECQTCMRFDDLFSYTTDRRHQRTVKEEMYSTIRNYLSAIAPLSPTLMISYSLPVDKRGSVLGRDYVQQFAANEPADCVFILISREQPQKADTVAICEMKPYRGSIINWITQYFNAHPAPDYEEIINMIRKEQTIEGDQFKFILFEWLIFSKVVVFDYNRMRDCANTDVVFTDRTYYPPFLDGNIVYYTGHGFRGWIGQLFETRLSGKKWSILRRPTSFYWITSDNPGFMVNIKEAQPGCKERQSAMSLTEIRYDTVLYYPLSKDYCLRIEPVAAENEDEDGRLPILFEDSTEEELHFVNQHTVQTHQEIVIGSEKELLKLYK